MASISCRHVKKVYPGNVTAVPDFNLEIADKEFIVFVGPSGCGKSTTLRMIAGLEEISGGELYIGGQLMNDVAPKDRDISMVFQNYALYPHMTVRENIAFPLKLRKMDKAAIDQRVEQAAEILDITEYLDRKPKALSGGQRQALTLLMATMVPPQLLLLDEHTAALDPATAEKVLELTQRIVEESHITCLMVTHNMTQALELGNRTLMMADGHIVMDVSGKERERMTVDSLVAKFKAGTGRALDNDRMLLS